MNYCTLFDSHYMSRGIAMYESLSHVSENFHLYVFTFDEKSYQYLLSKSFDNMTVISLNDFEDDELIKIKGTRTKGEYCWTCTPSTIRYCLKEFNLNSCTYIDADLYFFSDPKELINELDVNKSVLITEHRYTPEYDQSKMSGKYCVQFMTFINDQKGMEVLNHWRNQCIEWCFDRFEDGKFGDQKYLDYWGNKFDCVHELNNLGGGVAPWNCQQYLFSKNFNKIVIGKEKTTLLEFNLCFYHFHQLKILEHDKIDLCQYKLSDEVICNIYNPYIKHLIKVDKEITSSELFSSSLSISISNKNIKYYLVDIKRVINGTYNKYKIRKFLYE